MDTEEGRLWPTLNCWGRNCAGNSLRKKLLLSTRGLLSNRGWDKLPDDSSHLLIKGSPQLACTASADATEQYKKWNPAPSANDIPGSGEGRAMVHTYTPRIATAGEK